MSEKEKTKDTEKQKETILKTKKTSDKILCLQTISCEGDYIYLNFMGNYKMHFHVEEEYIDDYIDDMVYHIQTYPSDVLEINITDMPESVRYKIEMQVTYIRISYFIRDSDIYKEQSNTPILKEIIWRGVPILFDATKDTLQITIGVNTEASKTYDTDFLSGEDFEIEIEVFFNYIKIIDNSTGLYFICFPEKMFPEIKFCRLLLTPPGTAWYDFLFRGLYDPRLLCLIWSFASKI